MKNLLLWYKTNKFLDYVFDVLLPPYLTPTGPSVSPQPQSTRPLHRWTSAFLWALVEGLDGGLSALDDSHPHSGGPRLDPRAPEDDRPTHQSSSVPTGLSLSFRSGSSRGPTDGWHLSCVCRPASRSWGGSGPDGQTGLGRGLGVGVQLFLCRGGTSGQTKRT